MDKQIFQSLTVQGAVVLLIVNIAGRFNIQIGSEELTQVISAVLVVGGFVMTIIGRLRANKNLKIGSFKF